MSQEIAVFLTHPVTFSYHYKPITYVTLSQVPKKKKNPLSRGHIPSQNCSSSASGSSRFKSKDRNLLFVCGTNFC